MGTVLKLRKDAPPISLQALDVLNRTVGSGVEYQDAHSFVASSFCLSEPEAAELAHLYESQAHAKVAP